MRKPTQPTAMHKALSPLIALFILLTGCGGGGGDSVTDPGTPPSGGPVPTVPAALTMTYGIKSFNLTWGTVTAPVGGGTVSYRLLEDTDGAGPAASTQIGGVLAGNTFTQVVTTLLHTRVNAQYSVQACNVNGCSAASAPVTPNLTQAIGYFKASNTDANDRLGMSVALSADGSTLAVGALGEGSNATGINGNQVNNSVPNSGAVYVFIRSGVTWSQQGYLKASNTGAPDSFGFSVALSADGNTLAVGAYGESSNATGINGNQLDNSSTNAGAAYVFIRTGASWSQQAYVKASNTEAVDSFGAAIALSADGNTLAVGAYDENSNATGINGNQANNSALEAGAVYVYTRTAGAWSQQAYVKASNSGAGDRFGTSVSLSADGSTLAAGAHEERSNATGINGNQADNTMPNAGAVYVFTRSGISWSQQAYVKASNTGVGDLFGRAVSLSSDGSTLAVGAYGESSNASGINGNQADNSAIEAGAVYLFTRSGTSWSQQSYLKASTPEQGDLFGAFVTLSADGNTLAAGAYGESSNAIGINGNQADNSAITSGAVYVFTRAGTSWSQQAYVKASNTQLGDRFGNAMALSADGNTLAIGATGEDSDATGIDGNQSNNGAGQSGAVYIH